MSGRLYHIVPPRLSGDALLPLHRLAEVHPEAAEAARRKYDGRESLMNVRLPILDCLWNDVIHLAPLHPSKTRQALIDAGYAREELGALRFYAIEPSAIPAAQALFFRNSKDTSGRYDFLAADFTRFDPRRYRELDEVPREQRDYFSRMRREGRRPLLWARSPHVFCRAAIQVDGLEIVSW